MGLGEAESTVRDVTVADVLTEVDLSRREAATKPGHAGVSPAPRRATLADAAGTAARPGEDAARDMAPAQPETDPNLPAKSRGVTTKLLDVSMRQTDGPFGVRCHGFLRVPATGVYTFYGPEEYVKNICEPGTDLRLTIDGEEWYLGQRWHGLGRWSVPLVAGLHRFAVTFADARAKDLENQENGLWRNYPNPWVVWRGIAPVIEVSGPEMERQPIPNGLLCR